MSNESIDAIVDQFEVDRPEEMKEMLLLRDNAILDSLRLVADQQGLRPSITQWLLIHVGLGEHPDEATTALIWAQAKAEQEQMVHEAEEYRRRMEGG
jgi:hypothetical protein